MSKSTRDGPGNKGKQPGPGQYVVGSSFGTQGRSMGQKTAHGGFLGNTGNAPGPGAYNTANRMRPKTAGGTFGIKTGSSLAINPQTGANVGPGAYGLGRGHSSKNVKQNLGFGTDKHDRGVGSNSFAPGPGMYNTRTSMEIENGHIFGTSTRKGDRDLMGVPGPGQYNRGSTLKKDGASMKAKSAYGGFI